MKLSRNDIPKLEEYWMNHTENVNKLKYRKWELFSGDIDDDENTGGGANSVRSVTKPTERIALRLEEDNLYQNLKKITKAVNKLYSKSDDDIKTIVDMRYWDEEDNCFEWEEIADRLNMSRSKVLRLRNALLNQTAKEIGWV